MQLVMARLAKNSIAIRMARLENAEMEVMSELYRLSSSWLMLLDRSEICWFVASWDIFLMVSSIMAGKGGCFSGAKGRFLSRRILDWVHAGSAARSLGRRRAPSKNRSHVLGMSMTKSPREVFVCVPVLGQMHWTMCFPVTLSSSAPGKKGTLV